MGLQNPHLAPLLPALHATHAAVSEALTSVGRALGAAGKAGSKVPPAVVEAVLGPVGGAQEGCGAEGGAGAGGVGQELWGWQVSKGQFSTQDVAERVVRGPAGVAARLQAVAAKLSQSLTKVPAFK